jgi:predicted nucleic acid-binding protein
VTFDDLPDGQPVFVDANTFVYHYMPDPTFGPACRRLIERALRKNVEAHTSVQILGDVAHKLMQSEAAANTGRPLAGMLRYLQRHPSEIQKLVRHRQAIGEILNNPIHVITITPTLVDQATVISQQHGLLHNDALIVAVMQAHGLTNVASHDADFDRIPGLNRFAPA